MRVFYSMEVGMYIAKIATAAAIIKKNWQAGIVTFLSMPGHLTWALAGTL